MKSNFLKDILAYKQRLVKDKEPFFAKIKERLSSTSLKRYGLFRRVISSEGKLNLIAEIKKASPSKGMIREEFDLLEIAKTYVDNGAAAISVLTEDKYFLGKPLYVKKIVDNFDIPVLAKDFFISEGQFYEASLNGASAVLLIVSILDDTQLKSFIKLAGSLDLDCLVEVHNEDEMKRAVDAGADIIGVNNRDLTSFEVDLATVERILPKVPKGIVTVAESGIKTHEDIKRLIDLKVNAVLIGETFMSAKDIGSKIQEVMVG